MGNAPGVVGVGGKVVTGFVNVDGSDDVVEESAFGSVVVAIG